VGMPLTCCVCQPSNNASLNAMIPCLTHALQVRAISHVLDTNAHHFGRVPEVALSIRQLQDWCGKQGTFWAHVAAAAHQVQPDAVGRSEREEAGTAIKAPRPSTMSAAPGTAVKAPDSYQQLRSSAAGLEGDLTMSLSHVMALGGRNRQS
jgi:hypothetical protein